MNNIEGSRQTQENLYLDALIRLAFYYEEARRLQEELDPCTIPDFSEKEALGSEAYRIFLKKLDGLEARKNKLAYAAHLPKFEKKTFCFAAYRNKGIKIAQKLAAAACVLLVMVLGTSIALAVSEPIRKSVVQLLLNFGDEQVDIRLGNINPEDYTVEIDGTKYDIVCENAPNEWKGDYYPTYIPGTYKLTSIATVRGLTAAYGDNDGHILILSEYHEKDTLSLNSKNAKAFTIVLSDGKEVFVYEEIGLWEAVWSEGEAFILLTMDDENALEDVIRIAESMGRIQ